MTRPSGATNERAPRIEPLTRLATGGMADIWLSREIGAAGMERLVVVKRLLPHLSRDPEIVDMFVSEARFVARLVHPNVVQIHDLGEDDEGYFLVMEYVAGCSVRELCAASSEAEAPLPLAASLCIAEQACLGAHAAHELCDPTGKPLGLVHRDISPHNLMAGPSGEVKLLDFGIAKATAAAEVTRAGALKGKHGYMSPEQCAGDRLDRRSDVFALGIVCWELFTGARLFKRETEYATMHAIVSGDVRPPSAVRPDLPPGLDGAIGKALALDRAERWQTADAFRRALIAAAEESGIHPSRDALVTTMTALLGARLTERERALQEAARSGPAPEPLALRAALVHPEGTAPKPDDHASDTAATVVQRRPTPVFDEPSTVDEAPRRKTLPSAPPALEAARAPSPSQTSEAAPSPPSPPSSSESPPPRTVPPPLSKSQRSLFLGAAVLFALSAAAVLFALRPAGNARTPPVSPSASALADAPLTGPPLRFAVPPTVEQAVLRTELAPFLRWLGRSLDRPVELVIARSYDDTGDQIALGKADFGLLPPLLFVRAGAREPHLQPLAVRLFDGSRASDGYLLVRDEAALMQPADLRGKRICYVDRASTTGFLLPRIWMRKAGLVPDRDVEAVISGDHLGAMRDLGAGKCDAAAVYSGAYVSARQEGIAVGRLRVLAITGRVPQDVVVAAPGLPEGEAKRLREALIAFDPHRDIDAGRIGNVLGITGFAAFDAGELTSIREAAASEGLLPAGGPGGRP
ncbi:MAG: PhnD/SsuA/transferrin family substrate-binding protein [Byssovorax sp.]